MTEQKLTALAQRDFEALQQTRKTLAVAESCTGGWLSKVITEISGVSAVYLGGVCTYANSAKERLLGVRPETLAARGAVSEETAREMAEGVRKAFDADVGVGITGIAGPASDGTDKPVGLIYVAAANGKTTVVRELRNEFRIDVREQNRYSAVKTALELIGEVL
jgi:PncC family amidohydrolase